MDFEHTWTLSRKLCCFLKFPNTEMYIGVEEVEVWTSGLLLIDKTQAGAQKWFIRGSDRQALIWSIAASKTQLFKFPAISPLLEKRALIALQGSQCKMQGKGEYS